MPVKVMSRGTNGNVRIAIFTENTLEEVRDLLSMSFGRIPFTYREGMPTPMTYAVEEISDDEVSKFVHGGWDS